MKSLFIAAATCMAAWFTLTITSCNSGAKDKIPQPEDTVSILNPIPDSIQTSNVVAAIKPFTQVPPSSTDSPLTRIIKLDYQPGSKAIFIQDLRGKMYRMKNGKCDVYMDIKQLRPNFILQPGLATGFGSFAFHPAFQQNGLLYTTHCEPAKTAPADFGYNDTIPVTLQWVVMEWKTDPSKFPFVY